MKDVQTYKHRFENARRAAEQAKYEEERAWHEFQRACEERFGVRLGTWINVGDEAGILSSYEILPCGGIAFQVSSQWDSQDVEITDDLQVEQKERISAEEFESYIGFADPDWYEEEF